MSLTAKTSTYSSPWFDYYATIGSDKDLVALDPRLVSIKNIDGQMCRQIVCNGNPGNLVLTRADGTDVTLPILQGQSLELQCSKIKSSGTTATGIIVLW